MDAIKKLAPPSSSLQCGVCRELMGVKDPPAVWHQVCLHLQALPCVVKVYKHPCAGSGGLPEEGGRGYASVHCSCSQRISCGSNHGQHVPQGCMKPRIKQSHVHGKVPCYGTRECSQVGLGFIQGLQWPRELGTLCGPTACLHAVCPTRATRDIEPIEVMSCMCPPCALCKNKCYPESAIEKVVRLGLWQGANAEAVTHLSALGAIGTLCKVLIECWPKVVKVTGVAGVGRPIPRHKKKNQLVVRVPHNRIPYHKNVPPTQALGYCCLCKQLPRLAALKH